MNDHQLKAWQVCDEDIVAAATWDEAVAWWVCETGCDSEDANEEPIEVPPTHFIKYADGEKVNGADGVTVAEILAQGDMRTGKPKGGPFLVASTEF